MRLNISSHNIVYLFLQVIFRMNLLTFLLCLVMNRPYQFYYFVPSISFWFIVQFIVLLLPPQVSNKYLTFIKDEYGKWELFRNRYETMYYIYAVQILIETWYCVWRSFIKQYDHNEYWMDVIWYDCCRLCFMPIDKIYEWRTNFLLCNEQIVLYFR